MTGARQLEIEVTPPCPYRLPSRGRMDGVMRSGGGVLTRLLHIGGAPIVVHGWQRRDGSVAIRAVAAEPDTELPRTRLRRRPPECASRSRSMTT